MKVDGVAVVAPINDFAAHTVQEIHTSAIPIARCHDIQMIEVLCERAFLGWSGLLTPAR